MSRSRPCKVSVSVSSRGKNQTSRSRLGLVELKEGLGLGLVSDQKPNVSVSSRSRKLRSRLHPCFYTWCGLSANLAYRSEMYCMWLLKIQDTKNCHPHTIVQLCQAISLQLRHILTIWKKLVRQQYLLHMFSQYGELTAEIDWWVWGSPATFDRFRIFASLLHRHYSMEVNQTLPDVWLSPGLVHYIYTLWGSCTVTEFSKCKIYFAPNSWVLLYWQHYCMALEQWASAKLCSVVHGMELRNFRSSSFSTEDATYIPRAAITLGIGLHSTFLISNSLTINCVTNR